MDYKFECPHCGQRILASDDYIGAEVTCPTCALAFVVPPRTEVCGQPDHSLQGSRSNTLRIVLTIAIGTIILIGISFWTFQKLSPQPADLPQSVGSSRIAQWYGFGYEQGATLRAVQLMIHEANIARKGDLRKLLSLYFDPAQIPQEEFDWCYSGFSDGVLAKAERFPKQNNPPLLK